NGRVGMYGTSWSGFNSIQVACERPPALHAIVPIYASDDRYTDDVHYMGGALKAVDLVDWELYMAACNVLPPVPAVFGQGWRDERNRRRASDRRVRASLDAAGAGPHGDARCVARGIDLASGAARRDRAPPRRRCTRRDPCSRRRRRHRLDLVRREAALGPARRPATRRR